MASEKPFILLVEDNEDDIELTRHALSRLGLAEQLEVVRDGPEALDFLFATGSHAHRNADWLPRVVLLDLNLPRLGGLQVLERLRMDPHTSGLPVVVLTTSRLDDDVRASYALGANSYVRKPVESEAFRDAIHQLGRYWLGLNTPPPRPLPTDMR